MLTETIFKSYNKGLMHHATADGIEVLALGRETDSNLGARPMLFKTTVETFEKMPALAEEIFGPTSLVVEAESKEDLLSIAKNLSGHLTATVHGTEKDIMDNKDLIDMLEQKVGRLVINGFPTGVEVCHAMVHGGPYPSTTDGRSTSVGTAAIHRFTRPVCYQGMPNALLPSELKDENPLQLWRLINGKRTQHSVMPENL